MKILVLGCGQMGEAAVEDIYKYGNFKEIIIGTRRIEKAKRVAQKLSGNKLKISPREMDINNTEELEVLMRGSDVVVNCTGPNYMYELPVALSAIRTRVNLVDINDEYETTFEMLDLDGKAKEAGVDMAVLCDTNGGCLPYEVKNIVESVIKEIGIPVGIHFHNDSGVAVANSITAIHTFKNNSREAIYNDYGFCMSCDRGDVLGSGQTGCCVICDDIMYEKEYYKKENQEEKERQGRQRADCGNNAQDHRSAGEQSCSQPLERQPHG